MSMNAKMFLFVQEYCVDWNATQAYMRVYKVDEKSAGASGARLLENAEIVAAIETRKAELAAAAELTPQWVLQRWKEIALADPGDVIAHRRVNCRHCNGLDHHYQWTEFEYERAVNDAMTAKPMRELPDALGGFGFVRNGQPHPACPDCAGEGLEDVFIPDTRHLKGNAKRLYAGIKKTKDGIQVLTRDQDAALHNIAKFLGMDKQMVLTLTDNTPKGLADFYGKPEPGTQ